VTIRLENDEAGEEVTTETATVDVLEEDDTEDENGDDDSPSTPDPGPTIEVDPEPDTSGDALARIEDAENETILIDGESVDATTLSSVENVSLDGLELVPLTDRAFFLNVSTYEDDLTPSFGVDDLDAETESRLEEAATSFEAETETVSAGYVHVDHDLESEDVSNVTFQFSVRQSYLEDLGVGAEDVTLHREAETGWSSLPTEYVDSNETHHRYEATTSELSIFALGTGAPTLEVTDASLLEETITDDETATVNATIENRGQTDGEYTVELFADDDLVATENITIDGGDVSHAILEFEPSVGSYDLEVDGMDVDTLTVERADDEETRDDGDVDDSVDEQEEGDGETRDDGDVDDSVDEQEESEEKEASTPWSTLLLALATGALVILSVLWALWRQRDADVEITEISLRESAIDTGETATVDVTVENHTDHAVDYTVELAADGEVVATETVVINDEDVAHATLSFTPPGTGNYNLEVDDLNVGSLTVGDLDDTQVS